MATKKLKFVVSKKQMKKLQKWVTIQESIKGVDPVELAFCFSFSSGIGMKCIVTNLSTTHSISLTDYSVW